MPFSYRSPSVGKCSFYQFLTRGRTVLAIQNSWLSCCCCSLLLFIDRSWAFEDLEQNAGAAFLPMHTQSKKQTVSWRHFSVCSSLLAVRSCPALDTICGCYHFVSAFLCIIVRASISLEIKVENQQNPARLLRWRLHF